MGGGDLNLKKSWHPHTMKNQERVWKAEQKDSEEKRRIAELQREINAERDKEEMQKFAEDAGVLKKKDDVKLEWMYKGPSKSINHEDYLLGKAIDKNFERYNNEQRGGPSQDEESLPDAVRQAKSSMFSEQVDIQRKMHEDPLMAIRQRAVEKAKELYNNPVRLKQIRKMVSKSEEKSHKKDKKKKKKKSKKSSKKDEEEKELDALLTAKLKNALKDSELFRKLKKKSRRSNSESSSSSSSDSDGSEEEQSNSKNRKLHSSPSRKEIDHCKRSTSPQDKKQRHGKFNYDDREERKHPNRRDFREHPRKRSRSRSRDMDRPSRKKDNSSGYIDKTSDGRKRYASQEASGSRKKEAFPGRKESYRDRSSSASDNDGKKRHSQDFRSKKKNISPEKKKGFRDRSSSASDNDREKITTQKVSKRYHSDSDGADDSDDNKSRRKMTFGLMMADGSKPVVRQNPVQQEVKAAQSQQQKPIPWQKKERVKLTEEEKERRRNEMLNNAAWRDKEREENVKRYRKEEAQEKKQLHENFDDDFARKQFSRATDQASIEGRIKSKLNTIQRSKMAMDQNFARR